MHRQFLMNPSIENKEFFNLLAFTDDDINELRALVAYINSQSRVKSYILEFYKNLQWYLTSTSG